jgi:hypothetical protein
MKERFLPAGGFHKYLSGVVGCSVNRLEGLAAGAFLNREIAMKGKAIAGQTRSRQSQREAARPRQGNNLILKSMRFLHYLIARVGYPRQTRLTY